MKTNHVRFLTLLLCILLFSGDHMLASYEYIDHYITAATAIRSFDVTYHMAHLDFMSSMSTNKSDTTPEVWGVETNRQVYKAGLGWRFEKHLGTTNCYMGVLNLRQSRRGEATLHAYRNYYHYINPVIDAANGESLKNVFFLTDLLADTDSRISPLNASSDSLNLVPFQVNNPKLLGDQYIRIWLDPTQGCMLRRVEWYLYLQNTHNIGSPTLIERIEVDKYFMVDVNTWFPVKGRHMEILGFGQYKGMPFDGTEIDVDMAHTSWNSSLSEELFFPRSLPAANYTNNGWIYCYPTSALLSILRHDSEVGKNANVNGSNKRVLIVFILFFSTSVAALMAVFSMVRRRATHC